MIIVPEHGRKDPIIVDVTTTDILASAVRLGLQVLPPVALFLSGVLIGWSL